MKLETLQGSQNNPVHELGPSSVAMIGPDRWEDYRYLRLKALEEEELAFEDPELGLKRLYKRTQEEWMELLSNKLDKRGKRRIVFVSDVGKRRPAGMVALDVDESLAEKNGVVQDLFVAGNFRGFGLSRDLMEKLLEQAKKEGIESVSLHVYATQTEAINLYKSLGFLEIDTIENFRRYKGQPLTVKIMKKVLTSPTVH